MGNKWALVDRNGRVTKIVDSEEKPAEPGLTAFVADDLKVDDNISERRGGPPRRAA